MSKYSARMSWTAYVWYFNRLILSLAEVTVSIFLVSTRTVKRISNLISAEMGLFSEKIVLLCSESNGQCVACVHPIRDALG